MWVLVGSWVLLIYSSSVGANASLMMYLLKLCNNFDYNTQVKKKYISNFISLFLYWSPSLNFKCQKEPIYSNTSFDFLSPNNSRLVIQTLVSLPQSPDKSKGIDLFQTAGQLVVILDMGTELQNLTHKATAYWSSCIIEAALRPADIGRHSLHSLGAYTLTCPLDHSSNNQTQAQMINIWIIHLLCGSITAVWL